jgi:hypothetical protein
MGLHLPVRPALKCDLAARPRPGPRRRWLALIPALVAIAVAVPLVTTDHQDRWQIDHAAREPICAGDDGAEVCMARVNAFLLEDATEPVREQLARWDGVDGGFVRAVDRASMDDAAPAPEGTAVLDLANLISWNGGLSEESEYGDRMETVFAFAAADVIYRNCDPFREDVSSSSHSEAMIWAGEVVHYWMIGDLKPQGMVLQAGESAPFQVLLSKPEAEQKDWLGRYLAAARTCELAAFDQLMEELQ